MGNFFAAASSVGQFSHFALRALIAAVGALGRPAPLFRQIYSILVGALPLGVVAGVSLGAVIWMHTHSLLAQFNAAEFLPTALAAAVLLELSPIGAGLIVSARTGASLGAELGAMRLSEQIDAMEMVGVPPMRELVGPRVLACMIALPLLHVLIATLALVSGYLAENVVAHTTWLKYETLALMKLRAEDVIPAALKTVVFGYLIGVAGCYFGMRARGGTEGVGRAATSGVVASCLLVMAADVVLVALIQVLL